MMIRLLVQLLWFKHVECLLHKCIIADIDSQYHFTVSTCKWYKKNAAYKCSVVNDC